MLNVSRLGPALKQKKQGLMLLKVGTKSKQSAVAEAEVNIFYASLPLCLPLCLPATTPLWVLLRVDEWHEGKELVGLLDGVWLGGWVGGRKARRGRERREQHTGGRGRRVVWRKVSVFVCLCVCVGVRERKRMSERQTDKQTDRVE